MELKDLTDLIRNRRSIRRWKDTEISEDMLKQAIETAVWAPNAGNMQNWHFYIIVNRDTINAMAHAVQVNAEIIASCLDSDNLADAATRWRRGPSIFRKAPAVIVVASGKYQAPMDKVISAWGQTDPKVKQINEWRSFSNSRIQTAAAAISYLLLVLHQMGLGAVWMMATSLAKGEIEEILNVPAEQDIIALIPVGYPDESPIPKERRPIEDVCTIIR